MNLLQLLLGSLTSNDSVNSVSKKTGVSSKLTSKLLMMAVPLLISYMTKNASKKEGATSLLGALMQHNSKDTVSEQIATADSTDGAKIIGHILGTDQNSVISSLAKESGASVKEVNSILNSIAPALLNSLSTATTATAAKPQNASFDLSDGIDLSDIAGLLNGGKASNTQQNAAAGLLGSLLGGNTGKQETNELASLFGSLLGGSQTTAQNNAKAADGTELLSLLTSLMK